MPSVVIYFIITRAETKFHKEKTVEMDSPSLKGFHAQLDCKITANTRIVYIYIVSCSKKHMQNKTGMMNNIG